MNRCNRLCNTAMYLYVLVPTAYDTINYIRSWKLNSMAVQII